MVLLRPDLFFIPMNTHHQKTIAYAYPSSFHAAQLGFARSGCWFVALCAGAVTPSVQGRPLAGFPHAWQAADFADTLPEPYSRWSYQFARDYYSASESNGALCAASLETIAAA